MNRNDTTEPIRRKIEQAINTTPFTLERIRELYGILDSWTTEELQQNFTVQGFLSPFVMVARKSDGQTGLVMFQHNPRIYFNFTPDTRP